MMAVTELAARERTPARTSIRWHGLIETLHLPTALVLAFGLVAWGLLSERYGAYLFPPPSRVLGGLIGIASSGQLWLHIGASLYRTGSGSPGRWLSRSWPGC
jgi:ABC-type nitrate/sulfonate/bicarbonate transport system permease component